MRLGKKTKDTYVRSGGVLGRLNNIPQIEHLAGFCVMVSG